MTELLHRIFSGLSRWTTTRSPRFTWS